VLLQAMHALHAGDSPQMVKQLPGMYCSTLLVCYYACLHMLAHTNKTSPEESTINRAQNCGPRCLPLSLCNHLIKSSYKMMGTTTQGVQRTDGPMALAMYGPQQRKTTHHKNTAANAAEHVRQHFGKRCSY
jgi:hypothetical protein